MKSKLEGVFSEDYVPTAFENYALTEGSVSLQMWDTSGQEEYDKMRKAGYAQTNVFLVCFSVIEADTLESVKHKVGLCL